jgi:hypothetical protein
LQDLPGLGVQRGERLVHQQDRRVGRQRARDGSPLPHPTRQLVGIAILEAPEVHEPQELLAPLRSRAGLQPLELQRKLDVVPEREPGEERGVLEDDGAIGPGAGDGLLPFQHTPRGGARQPRDEVQDRGLAAPGRSQQAGELTGRHPKRRIAQDLDLSLGRPDGEGDALERDGCSGSAGRPDHGGRLRRDEAAAEPVLRRYEHMLVITKDPRNVKRGASAALSVRRR